jgi:hypothetical protein
MIFGPGFGESVLIHTGANVWIVIDSSIHSDVRRPAALWYLEKIGVRFDRVKFVMATHWHDDHVGGLSDVLESCETATFCCAAALRQIEFQQIVSIFNKNSTAIGPTGLTEMQRIFKILRSRKKHPKYALADRHVFSENGLVVTALSPSDEELSRFLVSIGQLMPTTTVTKAVFPDPSPNDLSVAAWVKVRTLDLLLGADLEEHGGSPGRGWTAVIASTTRPKGQAAFFKIAHHGSSTGHHPGIWQTLLIKGPPAVLTPWNRGRKLPSPADCARIIGLTPSAFSSANRGPRRKDWPPPVLRTLREAGIVVKHAEPPTGYVRLRRSLDGAGDWTVALSPLARPLSEYRT